MSVCVWGGGGNGGNCDWRGETEELGENPAVVPLGPSRLSRIMRNKYLAM
jgi:hypothetical protein